MWCAAARRHSSHIMAADTAPTARLRLGMLRSICQPDIFGSSELGLCSQDVAPLHLAAHLNRFRVIAALLCFDPEGIHIVDDRGQTAQDIAATSLYGCSQQTFRRLQEAHPKGPTVAVAAWLACTARYGGVEHRPVQH